MPSARTLRPSGSKTPRTSVNSGKPGLGVVPDADEHPQDSFGGPVDATGGNRTEHRPRIDRQRQGGEEQVVLGAEVVVDQRRVNASILGNPPHGCASESLAGERLPRRSQDLRSRVGPGRSTATAAGGRVILHAEAVTLNSMRRIDRGAPGSRPRAAPRGRSPTREDRRCPSPPRRRVRPGTIWWARLCETPGSTAS